MKYEILKALGPVGVLIIILVLGAGVTACTTLNVQVKDKAHCHLKTSAPHAVTCTVDGKIVYQQTGPMELDLKGCGGTE